MDEAAFLTTVRLLMLGWIEPKLAAPPEGAWRDDLRAAARTPRRSSHMMTLRSSPSQGVGPGGRSRIRSIRRTVAVTGERQSPGSTSISYTSSVFGEITKRGRPGVSGVYRPLRP